MLREVRSRFCQYSSLFSVPTKMSIEIPWSATPEFAGGFVIGWIACRMILNRLGLQVIHQPSSPAPACATHTLEAFSNPARLSRFCF